MTNPLDVLVTALAYLMKGDGEVSPEERAKLLVILNKHVGMKDVLPDQLKAIVSAGFTHARMLPVESFAQQVAGELTEAQQLSIFANLYDVALADGEMRGGEGIVLDQFKLAFDIDNNKVSALKEVLRLKNDTTIFTRPQHPSNDSAFKLNVIYERE